MSHTALSPLVCRCLPAPGWAVAIDISIPIFDRGAVSLAEQKARIEQDNARVSLQAQRQQIAVDVRRACLDCAVRGAAARRRLGATRRGAEGGGRHAGSVRGRRGDARRGHGGAGKPRSWAERAYPKLIYYNKLDEGGHFAAWEQPKLLVDELRAGLKSSR